jgi:N-acetyl-gamma-glutamylphosphate reductase
MPSGSTADTRSLRAAAHACQRAERLPQRGDTAPLAVGADNLAIGAAGQAARKANVRFDPPGTIGLGELPMPS